MPLIPIFIQNELDASDDNLACRLSAFNFCDPFDHILPFADGTVSAAGRQHLWGMYSGILAEEPTPPEPAPVVTGGGVWLEGLKRRRMRQLQREAEEATSRRQWRQKRRAKKRRGALRELQETLREAGELGLPEEAQERISKTVKPFTVRTYDGRLVPTSALDWQRLLDDSAAVGNLAGVMLTIANEIEEEEAAMVMMMVH